ncbi:thy-1 membrane glycoprotein [Amia ocellicauda]|uniref:thy-1 membrane glycoprotein n=1 Tax=Amia ocellicauda TaxID=2972642 RepID=UPI003463AF79
MYLPAALVLLLSVLTSAQDVTHVTACTTKENNLQMYCKFTPDGNSTINCDFLENDKKMGGTQPGYNADPTFKNRVNVTLLASTKDTCRLILTGFAKDKSNNYTCEITQGKTASKVLAVNGKSVVPCSALSVLFQAPALLMLSVMSLPALLQLLSV